MTPSLRAGAMPLMLVPILACGNDDSESVSCRTAFYADTVFYADADADGYGDVAHSTAACSIPSGYAATPDDCDDTNPSVHPGAAEVCDGLDNDCNDSVDDAAIDATWYVDTDADGFGAGRGCAHATGSTEVGGDCDDTNPAIHPGAVEICDGQDNDCNDSVDAAAIDASWYVDTDADGFGDVATDPACAYTTGSTDVGGDCDDTDPAVNPGADEICDDGGVDNDCDGRACETIHLSMADAKLVGEAFGDYAGESVSGAGDVDGDGHDDVLVGAVGNDEGGVGAGAAYLVLGPVTGTLDLSRADAKFVGEEAGDWVGYSVSDAGDVDGDGRDDVLIGSAGYADATYLALGPVTGTLDLSVADAELLGGHIVSGAGDVDGDGRDDMLVGSGDTAYLVLGPVTGILDLSLADAELVGEESLDYVGYSFSDAGDVDADGNDDLLIGGGGNDEGGFDAGAAYVVLGPVTGTLDLSLADAKLVGEAAYNHAGMSVSGARDVDGDGHDDLVVGAYQHSDTGLVAGVAYLVLGPVTGTLDLSLADATLVGDTSVGESVSGAGDVDADGHDDLLAGARLAPSLAAYLVLGPVTGTFDLSRADVAILEESFGDQAGKSVSDAGDVDGDGYDDLLVGAPWNTSEGVGPGLQGAAYLLYGGSLF